MLLTDDDFYQKWGENCCEELTYEERYKIWFGNDYETGMEYNLDIEPDFENDYSEPINNLMIKLNPNLDNIEIYQKFNDILNENIISFMNIPIINKNEHQTIINDMYLQLTSSIKNAYDSCCRTCSYNNIIKNKNWFTFELRKIKKEILELRFRNNNTTI